jgi:arylsulfatase A-like enzyme
MSQDLSQTKDKTSTDAAFGRREFMSMISGAGAMIATQGAVNLWPLMGKAHAGNVQTQRRNIIFFTTDQQQEPMWFPDGWEEENLPGLTRLRNKGVSFTRAYTNTAMCTPARTTLFTGLYPAQHGNIDTLSEDMTQSQEEHQLDPTLPNIATVLQAEGYDVVWKGKWHLSKGTEHPDGTYTPEDISRYGMSGWNSPDAGGDAKLKNYAGGTTNHDGRFLDGTTWQQPQGNPSDPNYIFTQADGPINADYERESVMAFLRHKIANPGGNPFCLIICLINPHDVLGCPGMSVADGGNGTYIEGGYFGRPDGSSPWSEPTGSRPIGLPPTVNEDLLQNYKPFTQAAFLASSAALGPVPTSQLKLKYVNFYGNLMKLGDRNLSKLLDLLDGVDGTVIPQQATALRDNSWIIFASDHGDMGMSHGGMRQKSFQFYEEVGRIPLVWSNPVDFPSPQVCDELVSHVDFMPTLCGILNINSDAYDFRGVDYSSLIRDPSAGPVQDAILFTFDDIWCGQDNAGFPNGVSIAPNRIRAIREKHYKYNYYFDGLGIDAPQAEFYDLRTKIEGGTDTDIDSGLGVTGMPIEYRNLSEWAENRRPHGDRLATPALVAKREQMQASLQTLIDTKLTPLTPRAATPPVNFKIKSYDVTTEGEQLTTVMQITWLSHSSTQYQLQSSSDMVTWENVGEVIPGNNGSIWIDKVAVDPKRFYRLRWSPKEQENPMEPDLLITVRDYTFENGFADTSGSGIEATGQGRVTDGLYQFLPGEGLTVPVAGLDLSDYAIDVELTLTETSMNFSKLIDFSNLTKDAGLNRDHLGRIFMILPPLSTLSIDTVPIDTPTTIRLARNANTRTLSLSINGKVQWSMLDPLGLAIPPANGNITFVADDQVTSGNEVCTGNISRVRISSGSANPVTPG